MRCVWCDLPAVARVGASNEVLACEVHAEERKTTGELTEAALVVARERTDDGNRTALDDDIRIFGFDPKELRMQSPKEGPPPNLGPIWRAARPQQEGRDYS